MRSRFRLLASLAAVYVVLLASHWHLLSLPYYWDEAGYYVPAALDFFAHGVLIPRSTLPTGHTPLLSVYLALFWRLFGYSPVVTRAALLLVAAATAVAAYRLSTRAITGAGLGPNTSQSAALWAATLMALSPLFFAQSSLAHLDLLAALFTAIAVERLLGGRLFAFAVAASLAVLSKETAVVLLPVAWAYAWQRRRERRPLVWVALICPLLPLLFWTLYYHHATGFWTGNSEYLRYNLYATANPARILLTLVRRMQEFFLAGFNWFLLLAALTGWRWSTRRARAENREPSVVGLARIPGASAEEAIAGGTALRREHQESRPAIAGDFLYLAVGISAAYLLMLSVVGGAVLPRYLLPALVFFYIVAVALVWRFPKTVARAACVAAAGCFVASWYLNPPYPFPFEDNLAYADFIRLHRRSARFLEEFPGQPVILTAWPATDELHDPRLGYTARPLHVVSIDGFTRSDFTSLPNQSFELLYLYSRKWEPPDNWVARFTWLKSLQARYFDYALQASPDWLAERFNLMLVRQFERRGQWVKIYARH